MLRKKAGIPAIIWWQGYPLTGLWNSYSLKEIANQLQEKSETVASSATELSASAENVVAGAIETASTISQIAGTVEHVTTNVQYIADTSKQAAGYDREDSEGIQRVTYQIETIQRATASSDEAINGLNKSAAKISQIVELLTQIAD